jgi:TonB family protein
MTTRREQFIMVGLMSAWLFGGLSPSAAENVPAPPAPKTIVAGPYPFLANLAGVQGAVELLALLSPEGEVKSVRVASGTGLLVEPAIQMLTRWSFEPCVPARNCEARVSFHFVFEPGMCSSSDCPSEVRVDLPATVTIRSKRRPAIVN